MEELRGRLVDAVRGGKRVTYLAKAFKVSQEGMGTRNFD